MADGAALADVKVLDLMWAIAGPAATRVLADYGATVVRVETGKRPEICRTVAPWRELPPGPESAVLFHNMNVGKLMMTLDLGNPAAREIVLDLVRWADVVTEAYSPGTMRALGLDYAALRAVKPDVIMLSTCLMGQTGPLATYAGFGNLAASITGFGNLCGWPDRPPAGPFGAYTDYLAPRFSLAALLAALDHRRRTGEGQHLDLAQGEAAIHFLGPAMLDYTVNGRVQTPAGNDDAVAAPHGVYPTAGDDRWIAIAVRSERELAGLAAAIGRPELADDRRFANREDRVAHRRELDAIVSAWTSEHDGAEAEARLQAAGVPAGVVQRSRDLLADPQLRHRRFFRPLTHTEMGEVPYEGHQFRIRDYDNGPLAPAPCLGEHSIQVLQEVLGFSDEDLARVAASGALT